MNGRVKFREYSAGDERHHCYPPVIIMIIIFTNAEISSSDVIWKNPFNRKIVGKSFTSDWKIRAGYSKHSSRILYVKSGYSIDVRIWVASQDWRLGPTWDAIRRLTSFWVTSFEWSALELQNIVIINSLCKLQWCRSSFYLRLSLRPSPINLW